MSTLEYLQQLEQLGPAGQWAREQIITLTLEKVGTQKQLEAAQATVRQLEQRVEQLQMQAHRQAAPFRRPDKQRNRCPGRPGRKGGHRGCWRPQPDHIDDQIHVPLDCCPCCGGAVCDKQPLTQYIEEIPEVRPRVTQLTTEGAWCARCQREVYSTHPLQTGRAGGAAATQLGPRALALACDLNKAKGLSMRQTVAILNQHFGLKLTPGGLAQLVQRVGRKLQPEYEQMAVELKQCPVVHADENQLVGRWTGLVAVGLCHTQMTFTSSSKAGRRPWRWACSDRALPACWSATACPFMTTSIHGNRSVIATT
jgi:hypothetical protein